MSFYVQWIQTSILNKSRRWCLNLKRTYLTSGPQHLQFSPKIWKEADCVNEEDVMACTSNVTVNDSENEMTRVRILTEFIAFPFTQILYGLNSWIGYALLPWCVTSLGERKHWIKNKKRTVWRGMGFVMLSYPRFTTVTMAIVVRTLKVYRSCDASSISKR